MGIESAKEALRGFHCELALEPDGEGEIYQALSRMLGKPNWAEK